MEKGRGRGREAERQRGREAEAEAAAAAEEGAGQRQRRERGRGRGERQRCRSLTLRGGRRLHRAERLVQGVRSQTVAQVHAYWEEKRRRLNRPLLREFQIAPDPNDPGARAAARRRAAVTRRAAPSLTAAAAPTLAAAAYSIVVGLLRLLCSPARRRPEQDVPSAREGGLYPAAAAQAAGAHAPPQHLAPASPLSRVTRATAAARPQNDKDAFQKLTKIKAEFAHARRIVDLTVARERTKVEWLQARFEQIQAELERCARCPRPPRALRPWLERAALRAVRRCGGA
eukprot:SAG11_NODE_1499_length_4787_cov_14.242747_1_plen_285_part_10